MPPATALSQDQPAGSRSLRLQQGGESLGLRLPPLLLAAERVAATVAQGVHGRRRVGQGETFWQFRRYQPGDSVTAIDWRQTGKGQHVFVREHEWAAAQSAWLWCDSSASMNWRSQPDWPTKRQRAELLAMALAVLLVRGGERVGLLQSELPPGAARSILPRIAEILSRPRTADPVRADRADSEDLPALEPLPRHAHLVLFGDFLGPLPAIRDRIAGFAHRGLQGHLVQVLDPAEEELPFAGRVAFSGPEGETELIMPRVDSIRSLYQQRLADQKDGLAALARAVGWSFTSHRTDRPPQSVLLGLWAVLAEATR
jgi:uncharacterized protein (DUF58 family)